MTEMFIEYVSLRPAIIIMMLLSIAGSYVWLFRFRRHIINMKREHKELYAAHMKSEENSVQAMKTLHNLEEGLARTESKLEIILEIVLKQNKNLNEKK